MMRLARRSFVAGTILALSLSPACGSSGGDGGGDEPPPVLRAMAGNLILPADLDATPAGSSVNLFELSDAGLVGPLASATAEDDGAYDFGGVDVPAESTVILIAEVLSELTSGRLAAQSAPTLTLGGAVGPGVERKDLTASTEIARVALLQLVQEGVVPAAGVDGGRIANLESGAARVVDGVDLADPVQVTMAATEVNEITQNGTTDGTPPPEPDPVCGNGELEDDEECDDGDANVAPGSCEVGEICCTTSCVVEEPQGPVCGNGIEEEGEECDDGDDNVDRDDCPAGETCCTERCEEVFEPEPEPCGNGQLDFGEQCDEGPRNVPLGQCVVLQQPACCTTGCIIEVVPGCGNFLVEPERGEACDQGPNGGVECCPDCQFRNLDGSCERG